MPVTEATYRQLSLEDPEGQWELVCGRLRQKPPMTFAHGELQFRLGYLLANQLDLAVYALRYNHARTRLGSSQYYIPDLVVVPVRAFESALDDRHALDAYSEPLPLVVEVWSPSTGDYDVTAKMAGYRERGDAEIWLVHPYDRTLTAWRRQPDGGYREQRYAPPDTVEPASLPGVRIDLAELFR